MTQLQNMDLQVTVSYNIIILKAVSCIIILLNHICIYYASILKGAFKFALVCPSVCPDEKECICWVHRIDNNNNG